MGVSRQGENEEFRKRSARLHNIGDAWYFTTRGGVEHGPFRSREAAEEALRHYVQEQVMNNPDADAADR